MIDLCWWAAGDLLLKAGLLWMVYLGIEPAVRARYPHSIVTWNRLLAGRWLDARIWADVLIGAAIGCAIWVAADPLTIARDALGEGGPLDFLLGARHWWGGHASTLFNALNGGLTIFALICGLRRLLRYDVLAALAAALLLTLTNNDIFRHTTVTHLVVIATYIAISAILAFALIRIGLVATMSMIFFINSMNAIWLGADWKAWYAPYGFATLVLLLGIAALAFWRALGSHELVGGGEELSAARSRA